VFLVRKITTNFERMARSDVDDDDWPIHWESQQNLTRPKTSAKTTLPTSARCGMSRYTFAGKFKNFMLYFSPGIAMSKSERYKQEECARGNNSAIYSFLTLWYQ